ncbi:hypothetical protein ACG2LH_01750 [Zhouia sp. PK063]|uniref:hypothetical protein n=1 Tax=Zhouia sp. PK063 TaxID=3373602 RepID=UPI0037891E49
MIKNLLFIPIAVLLNYTAAAQKNVEKTIFDAHTFAVINLNATNCFEVKVATHASKEIIIKAHEEGEYQNKLVITTHKQDQNLKIGVVPSPFISLEDDKLAAHKVVSVSIELVLPENLSINIQGKEGAIFTTGKFRNIEETADEANCFLEDIEAENINIQTFNGDIHLFTNNGNVKAISKYGKVEKQNLPFDNEKYELKTVNGNIYVLKKE